MPSTDLVPFRSAVRAWFGISLQTFGGPAGQIAVMHRTLVDERRWIGEQRFLHALNYCMLLPGPEAQQLAVYTGWLLNGTRGGVVAGALFVLPGMLALLALSAIYVAFGDSTLVSGLFVGLAPAVLAIVAQAVVRLGGRALTRASSRLLAVCAFLALALLGAPFPLVIAVAAVAGWLLGRRAPPGVPAPTTEPTGGAAPLVPDSALHTEAPSWRRALRLLAIGLVAWVLPMAAVTWAFGTSSVFVDLGLFFTWTALITFGGAYAVLVYVGQAAVGTYGWVTPDQMVDGLALAETTPGPLIMVLQFVAFLGAYGQPGPVNPWVAAVIGALLTTWVTFLPSFLFIFVGAPSVERLRGNRSLAAALTGLTAAVVGVIATLALSLAVHTLFTRTSSVTWGPVRVELPVPTSVSWVAVAICAVAAVLLFGLRWSVLRTLGVCAALGLVSAVLTG